MTQQIRTIMLKQGLPTVEEAQLRLDAEIGWASRAGVTVLKIIHGYGSSGVGGALKRAVRASLRKRCQEGTIRAFVGGEQWSVFDESTREIVDACPSLGRDRDLRSGNEGITIVLL